MGCASTTTAANSVNLFKIELAGTSDPTTHENHKYTATGTYFCTHI